MSKLALQIALLLFAVSVPARAQDIILQSACKKLAPAEAEESVAYTPGLDVKGEPVVPPNVEPPIKALDYPVRIPVEIDILKWLDLDISDKVEEAGEIEAQLAYITMYEDGRLEYNGQDISDRAIFLCTHQQKQSADPPLPENEEQATQGSAASAKSSAEVTNKKTETFISNKKNNEQKTENSDNPDPQ